MPDFKPIRLRGREITSEVLQFIQETIATHEPEGRSAISRILCAQWNWRQSNGGLKDMACRDLLLRLERLGYIQLPPRQSQKANYRIIAPVPAAFEEPAASPVSGRVDAFGDLRLEMVRGRANESLWNSLVDRYHYLGCRTIVGSYLKYLAYLDVHLVACLGWGSAAWKVNGRDRFIGWTARQRQQRLNGVANNVRFLILPWVRVQHLASKTLALSARHLVGDWHSVFKEELCLLETFVDRARFRGTSYQAANWLYVGQTKGSAKRGASYHQHGVTKAVWVYPLRSDFRARLCR
ncbi:MAG: Druantia anti-phage system protein DruA [bacterium]